MKTENISTRGNLISEIVKSYITDNLYEPIDELKEKYNNI